MHAYLIIDQNPDSINKRAHEIAEKYFAKILTYSLDKISEVRELIKFTSLTFNHKTAIFIQNIDNASNEALNAFLKLLEEPQENLLFVLGSSSELTIPQTITSRCQVIIPKSSNYDTNNILFAEKFTEMTKSERLLTLSKLKTREESIEFLNKLIQGLHAELHSNPSDFLKLRNYIILNQKTLTSLNMNGNVVAQLTNLGIQLDN